SAELPSQAGFVNRRPLRRSLLNYSPPLPIVGAAGVSAMAASHANGADRRRRLGIFAKTFERPSVDDVFAAVAGHGLANVQFNMASAGLEPVPEAVPEDIARGIAAAASRRGIAIAALSGTVNLIHPDKAARREGLARLRRLIASAGALGTGIVTLCTGTRDP